MKGYTMLKEIKEKWKSFEKKWDLGIMLLKELPDDNDDHFVYISNRNLYKLKSLKVDLNTNHVGLKFISFESMEGWYYPEDKMLGYVGMFKHYHPEFKEEFISLFETIMTYLKERNKKEEI